MEDLKEKIPRKDKKKRHAAKTNKVMGVCSSGMILVYVTQSLLKISYLKYIGYFTK